MVRFTQGKGEAHDLPGMPEERILEELVADQKLVASHARKLASKCIARQQRTGRDGIDDDIYLNIEDVLSRSHNRWLVLVCVNMARNPKWHHQAVCYVESGHGTRDYYMVRGFSNRKPYFIRISSHTLGRMYERFIKERLNVDIAFSAATLPLMLIRKGEAIPWMKITDPRLLKVAMEAEDRNRLSTLFYTYHGCYLGYETPCGNVEFRTFLNNNPRLRGDEETLALSLCRIGHVGLNPKMYTKAYRDTIFCGEITLSKEMEDTLYGFKDRYRLLP